MKAEELANKFAAYMLVEISHDIKQGTITTDMQLHERFRDDYKAWKQLFTQPEKFVTLFAVEVEKLAPYMKNKWK
jgi:hypothetical protein